MKLGAQLTLVWMMAVSVGGAYAGIYAFSGGSETSYQVAHR